MAVFSKKLSLRWSDLDPNFHVRHSVYYDFGAQHRIEVLHQLGLTPQLMKEQAFGPILFREECVFRREIRLDNQITIHTSLSKMKPDASRWSIVHQITNEKEELCAVITVDGAWMDLQKRKIASPTPTIVLDIMNGLPKTDTFEWI